MCGIAGVVSLNEAPPDVAAVRAMTDALVHRGPDGEGLEQYGAAALGHRRLAILDLSDAGAQPMRDASGRYRITYNGEIYNYVELREQLEAAGVVFRSRSDTEVLLEAYARWGADAVPRLNGMFAFAVWDTRDGVLFAARDRFGEKPFFYRLDTGREFRFASEIKALRAAAGRPFAARQDVLFRFLAYRQTGTSEETFFEDVTQLPAAHTLTLRDGRIDVRRYWTLPDDPEPPGGTESEQVARVAGLLDDAVRIRLRSDVPVGSCLSGGLDSSTIVALVSRLLESGAAGPATTRQLTFSAAFPDSPADETHHARAVARATGVEPHEVIPTAAGLADDLARVVAAQDEPFSGPSIYAEWRVMELARTHGVTVLLNGQGADELFAGYTFYFSDLWFSLLRRGRVGELRREMRAYDADHGARVSRALLRGALRSRVPDSVRRVRGGPRLPWLGRDFIRAGLRPTPRQPSSLRESLRDSLTHRMLPHLLRQADRNSMAFSREARLPFLDHRLVEYVDALGDSLKLRGGTTKWALRQAVRGLIPESVRTRSDKIGFAVPTSSWLRGPLAPAVADTLGSRRLRERGIFDAAGLEETRRRFDAGDDAAGLPLWNAFVAELWMQLCVDA